MAIDWCGIATWALDYSRAVNDRPCWCRVLMHRLMGRYARNEWNGLQQALKKEGMDPELDYDLEGMDYHSKKQVAKGDE